MSLLKIKYLFVIGLFVMVSCRKNELKKPSDVSFKVDINRNESSSGHLVFTGGTINLASFDVEGERQEGDDISFSREFSNGLLVEFDPDMNISELAYEIPQGVYERLSISFDTFDDNTDVTIVCLGTYTNGNSESIPVRFEFMSAEYFSIDAEEDSGETNIILDKDTPANALLELDPIYWFDILSTNQLDNAELVDVEGVQTILINDSVNDGLYDLLSGRVEESTEVLF